MLHNLDTIDWVTVVQEDVIRDEAWQALCDEYNRQIDNYIEATEIELNDKCKNVRLSRKIKKCIPHVGQITKKFIYKSLKSDLNKLECFSEWIGA